MLLVLLIIVAALSCRLDTSFSFDRFNLIATVSDVADEKHAAIFNYNHAESSANVMAVWLLEGKFTEITKNDLEGKPAIIRPLAQSMPRITWQTDGRLLVEVEAPVYLYSQDLWRCYSPANPPERPYLCYNSSMIDFLVTEQVSNPFLK